MLRSGRPVAELPSLYVTLCSRDGSVRLYGEKQLFMDSVIEDDSGDGMSGVGHLVSVYICVKASYAAIGIEVDIESESEACAIEFYWPEQLNPAYSLHLSAGRVVCMDHCRKGIGKIETGIDFFLDCKIPCHGILLKDDLFRGKQLPVGSEPEGAIERNYQDHEHRC